MQVIKLHYNDRRTRDNETSAAVFFCNKKNPFGINLQKGIERNPFGCSRFFGSVITSTFVRSFIVKLAGFTEKFRKCETLENVLSCFLRLFSSSSCSPPTGFFLMESRAMALLSINRGDGVKDTIYEINHKCELNESLHAVLMGSTTRPCNSCI